MIIQRSGIGRLKAASRIAIILTACISLGFLGCDGKKEQAKEPVVTKQIASSAKTDKKANKSIKTEVPSTPADAKSSSMVADDLVSKRPPYNPIGKIDPFAPLYKDEPKTPETVVVKAKEPERPRTPLEKLDLGQLKLTAIVTTQDHKRALVEEASGKGYVVEIGTRIGLERGSVIEIDQNRIVIEHEAEDDFGRLTNRRRELKLQKPPGD